MKAEIYFSFDNMDEVKQFFSSIGNGVILEPKVILTPVAAEPIKITAQEEPVPEKELFHRTVIRKKTFAGKPINGNAELSDANCLIYNKPFKKKRKDQIYCSHECLLKSRKVKKVDAVVNIDRPKSSCIVCGADFISRKKGQACCSKRCSSPINSKINVYRKKFPLLSKEEIMDKIFSELKKPVIKTEVKVEEKPDKIKPSEIYKSIPGLDPEKTMIEYCYITEDQLRFDTIAKDLKEARELRDVWLKKLHKTPIN
jgi:hypothetical protein